jgi:TolB-like protein
MPRRMPRHGRACLTFGLHFPYRQLILCVPGVAGARSTAFGRQGNGSLRYLFGDYAFDTDRRELHRGSEVVSIAPQVFDLIDYLIRNRERVVSKDDLIDAIWKGRSVSDAALTTRMNAARTAIGDSGEEQRLIKTLPRKGFRFIGMVREAEGAAVAAVVDNIVEPSKPAPALPDKPSIAVLPFQNLSGDPEQEYFADGIADDVLTTLSKIQELLVIARASSFVFKGQARDIREIGQMLGARYVLEGSVRKAGNRVRLTAQLIDSLNGGHVWADRFEGDVDAVFELQDRITQDIVAALEVRLTLGEEVRVWRKRSGSPLVYEHFLKAWTLYVNFAKHTHAEARREFERALAVNPHFIPALGMLGFTLTDQVRFGWEKDQRTTYEAALEYAAHALAVDPDSDVAYVTLGYIRLCQRRHDDALAAGEKAIVLAPSSASAYHVAGMIHGYAGDFRKAVRYAEQSQRLSPLSRNESRADEARVRFHLGDLVAARDIASRVLIERPGWLSAQTTLAAALWNIGKEEEARVIVGKMMASHPNLTASRWAQSLPYRHQKDLDAMPSPLRMAGLPEQDGRSPARRDD